MASPKTIKNVILLALCQALGLTAVTMLVTTSAIIGNTLAPDKSLATLPQAVYLLSTTVMTIPASWWMARIGRRLGFVTGTLIGVGAALLGAQAVIWGDFWLYVLAASGFGLANGFVLYYRFAAGELAEEAFKPKAISLILTGGIVAAVAGPEISKLTRDAVDPHTFAGTYLAVALLPVLAMVLLTFVDFAPMPREEKGVKKDTGRPLREIARQREYILAVSGAVIGYAVMAFVMTATPLAVLACAHSFEDAAFVIEWHVLGMFVPSFFTGNLIARFGVHRMMLTGCLLLLGSIATSLMGVAIENFWLAMVLLGVGWNFLFIGGTTLLTRTYRPEEKAKAQGLNEFLVFGITGMASLSAGAIQNTLGWTTVNLVALPAVLVAFIAVLLVSKRS